MIYDRKIKYLEYMENGEKIRGAGFVKTELRGTLCRMQISVKGLHETDRFEKQVLLTADKQEGVLCKIWIEGGRGDTGELRLDSRNLGESGISYEQLEEIRIPVAAGKEIRCRWQERKAEGEEIQKPRTELPNIDPSKIESPIVEPEPPKEQAVEEKEPEIKVITWRPEQEIRASEAEVRSPMFPLDDKWKQLSSIYPHIAPFEDERDYLSLGPSDFVIFPSRYYRVINNSFLLHGYHNYEHLILPGETKDSKKVLRYLHESFGNDIYVSIMNQYTPLSHTAHFSNLNRRVTSEEYDRVLNFAERIGIEHGFRQEGETASESFIPEFDGKGL